MIYLELFICEAIILYFIFAKNSGTEFSKTKSGFKFIQFIKILNSVDNICIKFFF